MQYLVGWLGGRWIWQWHNFPVVSCPRPLWENLQLSRLQKICGKISKTHSRGEYLWMLIVSAMLRYGNSKKSEIISHKVQSKQFWLCGCWNPWSMQTRTDSNFPKQFLDSVRRIMRRALCRPPLQNIHDSPLFKRAILCDFVDTSQIYRKWSLFEDWFHASVNTQHL